MLRGYQQKSLVANSENIFDIFQNCGLLSLGLSLGPLNYSVPVYYIFKDMVAGEDEVARRHRQRGRPKRTSKSHSLATDSHI